MLHSLHVSTLGPRPALSMFIQDISVLYEYLLWHDSFILPDLNEETIHLADAGNVSIDKLSLKIPSDCARYHLYNFKHTHEGDYLETLGMFCLLTFISQIYSHNLQGKACEF